MDGGATGHPLFLKLCHMGNRRANRVFCLTVENLVVLETTWVYLVLGGFIATTRAGEIQQTGPTVAASADVSTPVTYPPDPTNRQNPLGGNNLYRRFSGFQSWSQSQDHQRLENRSALFCFALSALQMFCLFCSSLLVR